VSKYTKKARTEVFKDAIDARIVSAFGYDFVEEERKILFRVMLDDSELNKLHEWSKLIRRMDRGVTDEQDRTVSEQPCREKSACETK
jgi:hypothetical protein